MKINLNKAFIFVLTLCIMFFSVSCSKEKDSIAAIYQMDESIETRLARICIEDYDSITFRIYEDAEPELVERFFELCNEGYYDGTDFFNIVNDYLIMGGKAESGKSIPFSTNSANKLYPLRGALCANMLSETACELNNFYIIANTSEMLENLQELLEYKNYDFRDYLKFGYDAELTSDELEKYMEYGGAPWLEGHTVVFGQAYEGIEVLEQIFRDHSEDGNRKFIIKCIETY